jgi:hypothetical protein
MTKSELNSEYFEWMCQLVNSGKGRRRLSYRKLLTHLNRVEFTYTIRMDVNRAKDGRDLRYRFGYEHCYERARISAFLDDGPCTVLEMLIALTMRCEEHIMDDPEAGNRLGQWFWDMINNLRLESMTDDNYDSSYTSLVISKLLNHDYGRNGDGGLFTVKHCIKDLRKAEIWYQMCWYLAEIS